MIIETRNLAFRYPGAPEPVLKNLSFGVETGEVFGMLGPSGAGKSTLQNILLGVIRGAEGEASVFGAPIGASGRAFYERVGVSFELPALYLRLTALENLQFFSRLYSGETRDPMTLLEAVGLERDAHKRVEAFSKGMKMRLNLCRALINEPELVFLDEPTTGQDPARAKITRALISELKAEGKTVFLTTHNMAEADEICDRVAFLVDGRADTIDKPAALKRQYGKPQVEIVVRTDEGRSKRQFELSEVGSDPRFLDFLQSGTVESMHSQEASLDDVFVAIAGGAGHGER